MSRLTFHVPDRSPTASAERHAEIVAARAAIGEGLGVSTSRRAAISRAADRAIDALSDLGDPIVHVQPGLVQAPVLVGREAY
ncbi:MAG: hypothetical protein AAGI53_02455 [Planctomycetota bacterium]